MENNHPPLKRKHGLDEPLDGSAFYLFEQPYLTNSSCANLRLSEWIQQQRLGLTIHCLSKQYVMSLLIRNGSEADKPYLTALTTLMWNYTEANITLQLDFPEELSFDSFFHKAFSGLMNIEDDAPVFIRNLGHFLHLMRQPPIELTLSTFLKSPLDKWRSNQYCQLNTSTLSINMRKMTVQEKNLPFDLDDLKITATKTLDCLLDIKRCPLEDIRLPRLALFLLSFAQKVNDEYPDIFNDVVTKRGNIYRFVTAVNFIVPERGFSQPWKDEFYSLLICSIAKIRPQMRFAQNGLPLLFENHVQLHCLPDANSDPNSSLKATTYHQA